ncbi:hypothetical protein BBR01nite_25010 [Brevibacillus brevis]|nr:hypothetical protein BBR01nite_25010 [Brevibacillus brevis]
MNERSDSSISSEIIRGHIDTIILRVLCDGDNYGYEIIKAIFKNSDGRYELKEPSLYTSLKSVEGLTLPYHMRCLFSPSLYHCGSTPYRDLF